MERPVVIESQLRGALHEHRIIWEGVSSPEVNTIPIRPRAVRTHDGPPFVSDGFSEAGRRAKTNVQAHSEVEVGG